MVRNGERICFFLISDYHIEDHNLSEAIACHLIKIEQNNNVTDSKLSNTNIPGP